MMARERISFTRLVTSAASPRQFAFKFADQCLGPLLKPSHRRPALERQRIRRILCVRPGGLGDAVLALPLLRALRQEFPQAELDVIAERRNLAVFGLAPGIVSSAIRYDEPGFLRLLAAGKGRYDLAIDTEQWHWFSAFVCQRLCSGPRIGFDTRPLRTRLYTLPVAYSQGTYEGDNFMALLKPLGEPRTPAVFPGPGFLAVSGPGQREAAAESGPNACVLYLSASIPQRHWPREHWRQLISFLLSRSMTVVLVGGGADDSLASGLAAGSGGRVLARTGAPLARTAAFIAAARLFIGADSGILHLAYALGCPTVSFFGPGIEAKWAPRGAGHAVVNKRLPCSPCTLFGYTPRCGHGSCMRSITPEDVIAALPRT